MYFFDKVHRIGLAILRMKMKTKTTMIGDAKAMERRLGHNISAMKISQGCLRQCQNGVIISFRDGTTTYQLSTISGSWTTLTMSLWLKKYGTARYRLLIPLRYAMNSVLSGKLITNIISLLIYSMNS